MNRPTMATHVHERGVTAAVGTARWTTREEIIEAPESKKAWRDLRG
jgi:hypothetical protein